MDPKDLKQKWEFVSVLRMMGGGRAAWTKDRLGTFLDSAPVALARAVDKVLDSSSTSNAERVTKLWGNHNPDGTYTVSELLEGAVPRGGATLVSSLSPHKPTSPIPGRVTTSPRAAEAPPTLLNRVLFPFYAENEGELSVSAGEMVALVRGVDGIPKGWALVAVSRRDGEGYSEQGFVPLSFLGDPVELNEHVARPPPEEPVDPGPGEAADDCVTARLCFSFVSEGPGEISVPEGALVYMHGSPLKGQEPWPEGWTFITTTASPPSQGFVPTSFLQPLPPTRVLLSSPQGLVNHQPFGPGEETTSRDLDRPVLTPLRFEQQLQLQKSSSPPPPPPTETTFISTAPIAGASETRESPNEEGSGSVSPPFIPAATAAAAAAAALTTSSVTQIEEGGVYTNPMVAVSKSLPQASIPTVMSTSSPSSYAQGYLDAMSRVLLEARLALKEAEVLGSSRTTTTAQSSSHSGRSISYSALSLSLNHPPRGVSANFYNNHAANSSSSNNYNRKTSTLETAQPPLTLSSVLHLASENGRDSFSASTSVLATHLALVTELELEAARAFSAIEQGTPVGNEAANQQIRGGRRRMCPPPPSAL